MGRPYIDLRGKLASIGLDQYYEILTSEGFDTWESMLDITEDDLERLHFKLGCRRRLMRTIATYRGYPIATPLPIANTSKNCLIADSQPKNLKTSTYPEQPVKLTYWQSPEISIIAPKLPQENPAVDVRAYQINVASFHREQVKKIAEASKPVKLGVIYDNRRAEDEDGCTVREYLRSLELVGNIKLSVLAPKEGPPDDSDQALWEFINF